MADGGVIVLSGAGLSTESGIPDYRGPTGRARRAEPMTYQTFVGGPAARQRYWARSHVGWRHVARAIPNAGHRAVAELERRGLVAGIITQNVDGLHQAAGRRQVIELHGGLDRVLCLSCGERTARTELDQRLRAANPGWAEPRGQAGSTRTATWSWPTTQVERFQVVDCGTCGGLLKPDVVFFGENVPPDRVDDCYALVERRRRAAGAGLLADRDVRLPVRPAGGQAGHPGGDRQPGPDPRRRAGHRHPGRAAGPDADPATGLRLSAL